MDIKPLKDLIEKGLSTYGIAKELNTGQTSVRYWLKKYQLKTKHEKFNSKTINGIKPCPKCGEDKPINEFYIKSKYKESRQSWCKSCMNKTTSENYINKKKRSINYLGGECEDCSIPHKKDNYFLFDFHHLDPSQKDVDWSKLRRRSWDKITLELDKCACLCSNCHRTRHHNERKNP